MDASCLHRAGNQFFNELTPNSLDNFNPSNKPMSHPSTDVIELQALSAHVKTLGHDMTVFYHETYDEIDDARQNACCKRCGRKLSYGGADYDNDAMKFPCLPDEERARESSAWLTGASPRLLLERLTQEVAKLPIELQRLFDPGHFDAGRERLDSEDWIWRLKWYLRDRPQDPISASNPQPPGGIVELERLVSKENIFKARYIGPKVNPNIGDNPDYWLVEELDTDTDGIAYQDEGGVWRFRRITGAVGYRVPYEHLRLLPAENQVLEPVSEEDEDSERGDFYFNDSPMTSGDELDPMSGGF